MKASKNFNFCSKKNEDLKFTIVCFDGKDRMLISSSKLTQSVTSSKAYTAALVAIQLVISHKLYANLNVEEVVLKTKAMISEKIGAQIGRARASKSPNKDFEIAELTKQKEAAVVIFEESQKELAVKLTHYVKATLIFTIQKASPSAAAPLADHVDSQPLHSPEEKQ